jgi:hypothetical protein
MRRYLTVITLVLCLGLIAQSAGAVDSGFTLAFANPRTEITLVVIAYDGLTPVSMSEIAAGETSADLSLLGMEPGSYRLYLSMESQIEVQEFPFVLNEDGSVQFETSPALQQNGPTVIVGE